MHSLQATCGHTRGTLARGVLDGKTTMHQAKCCILLLLLRCRYSLNGAIPTDLDACGGHTHLLDGEIIITTSLMASLGSLVVTGVVQKLPTISTNWPLPLEKNMVAQQPLQLLLKTRVVYLQKIQHTWGVCVSLVHVGA